MSEEVNMNNNKRRRTSLDVFHIHQLPNALLADVASYLPSPSQALLALSMTAPIASWCRLNWKGRFSEASHIILTSISNKTELDFGDIERSLSCQLTDDDIIGILLSIDAKNTLRTLKLTGCVNISGRGLEVLDGSRQVEYVDLGLVAIHEDPFIDPDPLLCEATVLPIIDNLMDSCTLKYIHLPVKWRDRPSPELKRSIEAFNQQMRSRDYRCSHKDCNLNPVDMYDDGTWYIDHEDGSFGTQSCTCCICSKYFCYEHDGGKDHLRDCCGCQREYCSTCVPNMTKCASCDSHKCQACGELTECGSCNQRFCSECCFERDCCGEVRCQNCKPALICDDKTCRAIQCTSCFDGKLKSLECCGDCNTTFCFICRYVEYKEKAHTPCSSKVCATIERAIRLESLNERRGKLKECSEHLKEMSSKGGGVWETDESKKKYTCNICSDTFCYIECYLSDERGFPQYCGSCLGDYCIDCVPLKAWESCHCCGQDICCGEFKECEACLKQTCSGCLNECKVCHRTRCSDCDQYRKCNGRKCSFENCGDCFDIKNDDSVGYCGRCNSPEHLFDSGICLHCAKGDNSSNCLSCELKICSWWWKKHRDKKVDS